MAKKKKKKKKKPNITTIKCVDCGINRKVGNAQSHLIVRCIECQKEMVRKRNREGYRRRKGLPLDYDPDKVKKEKKTGRTKKKDKSRWLSQPGSEPELDPVPKELIPELTPEEKIALDKRRAGIIKLLDLLDSDYVIDDW